MHQRRRRRRRQHRETWGKKNYFSVFSHSPGLSLLLLFNPPRSTRTLQGLHSGSDKTYDALIIDEDKVRFFVDSLSAASPVFLFSVSLLSLSFLLPLPTLQKKKLNSSRLLLLSPLHSHQKTQNRSSTPSRTPSPREAASSTSTDATSSRSAGSTSWSCFRPARQCSGTGWPKGGEATLRRKLKKTCSARSCTCVSRRRGRATGELYFFFFLGGGGPLPPVLFSFSTSTAAAVAQGKKLKT